MFKSMDSITNRDVVILDPIWNDTTIGSLRVKSREDHLLCPTCKQPVRVRAGEKKRWHFAHKTLSDCPLAYESQTILQARSLLYKWLNSKLGDILTIEKHFPGSDLPRPIDCYYETSAHHKIGYWILEKGLRSRFPLQGTLNDLNIEIQWIFLSNMIRIDEEDSDSLHLCPTERDFAFTSQINQLYSPYDQALNYLDVDSCKVTTFRGLHCVHLPQLYRFHAKLQNDLENVLVIKSTGELVHPGEYEELKLLEERRRIEEQRKAVQKKRQQEELLKQQEIFRREQLIKQQEREAQQKERAAASNTLPRVPPEIRQPSASGTGYLRGPFRCVVCGKFTENWTTLDTKTNTCVCSIECLRKQQGRI